MDQTEVLLRYSRSVRRRDPYPALTPAVSVLHVSHQASQAYITTVSLERVTLCSSTISSHTAGVLPSALIAACVC